MNLKDTLNLPSTDFPMRGDLVKREPARLEHWKALGLYEKIQEKRAHCPSFILHDGPPFTSGDVHLGTALNKILKDVILRFKSLRGYRTPYVPGWDCHGLPIEQKVTKRLREEGRDLDPAGLRAECATFSNEMADVMRGQFERLGILGEWDEPYRTLNPAYEADILRTFATFVEQGLVYRSKKPVYWSIPYETALAEAEVEYREHTSPAIYVKFPLPDAEGARAGLPANTSIVIWTTTPWTLPANLAIAVHPDLEYVALRDNASGEHFLVAQALAEAFVTAAKLDVTLAVTVTGAQLEALRARHPFIDRESLVVTAGYVTTDAGTGCVHTAPGHGADDYVTGRKYNLEIYCPVGDDGKYVDDGQLPERLVGLTTLETDGKPCPANLEVLRILSETGSLLAKQNHKHQYPHCWRSKTPIVFRAMDQWFVALDQDGKRAQVLAGIEQVDWVPDYGIKRIRAAVENRPDWCISRQRSWGVPLPAFYDPDGQPLLDAGVIRALAAKIEQHGTNLWFEKSPEELLDGIALPEGFNAAELKKGGDTLDVWIDSGCSHRAVLQRRENLTWPADLYLEGSDQHRGWFQSSIWTATIADGSPPFRQVLTHGFIVEETGEKLSKSKGAMSSDGWVNQFGADIVRLWTASQDFRGDIKLSVDYFKKNVATTYRGIRNTLLYQLGNLSDFDRDRDAVVLGELEPLDQWALHQLALFIDRVTEAYDRYELHRVYQEVDNFVGVTLSRLYHDMLKDRLYTFGRTWRSRRSAQTVVDHCFSALTRVLSPILTFTADEAWSFYRENRELVDGESVHLQDWPEVPEAWRHLPAARPVAEILTLRDPVNEQLEELRRQKMKSLDAAVTIRAPADSPLLAALRQYEDALPELFIVSQVTVETAAGAAVEIHAERATGEHCPRSWRWVPELVDAGEFGRVSPRDREALLKP
ncbi:MAG: isoleucine--tRNA ligase [Opitutales bacterium]